jgi:transcriptional regulator with XRE-family HTH domain
MTKGGKQMKHTLREWRRIKEVSQKELADLIKVHVNTIINWEENPGKMTADKAALVANALGVPFDDILFLPSALQNVEQETTA